MVKCPHCDGERAVRALVNRGGTCMWESIACITCGGRGEVDDDYARRDEYARAWRRDRIKVRRESLNDAALRLGVPVVSISGFERNRLPRGEWEAIRDRIEEDRP